MEPRFIELSLGKFQRCCFPGCNGDAVKEASLILPDGSTFFAAGCHRKGHYGYAERACACLDAKSPLGLKLTEGVLQHERIFYSPVGKEGKCRWDLWVAYTEKKAHAQTTQTPSTPQTIQAAPVPLVVEKAPKVEDAVKVIKVCATWEWIANSGKWMTIEGEVVWMSALTDQEIICSAKQIVKENYQRVPKRAIWVKAFEALKQTIQYPEEELRVGSIFAGTKLDEFKQLAEERELI
jgi:hypothetical protein